jgi:hypothetical protein
MIGINSLGSYGRLGNQMFQYAAIKGIAANKNYDWAIPPKKSFTKYPNSNIHECFKLHSLKNYEFIDGDTVQESNFYFDENLYNNCPDNTNLFGYFQTEKYFKAIKNKIIKDFEFLDIIQTESINYLKKYSKITKVSIHIRRTDYLTYQDIHCPPSIEYYKTAMNFFENCLFFVFSDDTEWCKLQNIFDRKDVIIPEVNDTYIDLCLMSMCDHNIIANSSYSWWASYLNKNLNKKIIAPSRWFGEHSGINSKDLYNKDWIIIES